ncbi:MAG: hypothetical protein EXR72_13065 [Myxococcales bacterium]|nr:hypothetical protein [Myxococcales bacterium]
MILRGLVPALIVSVVAGVAEAARFVPGGAATVGELIGGRRPSAETIRAAVQKTSFYAGPPIGAGLCARCHADVAAQWSSSAHRFASFNNPYYAAAVNAFRDEKGKRESRFCADCHDPTLVADGSIDRKIDVGSASAQAGIVCLVCHSITRIEDLRGNGRFHAQVDPVPYGAGSGHGVRLRPALLATSQFCGTCHKVGLTEEVTGERWLRGQNDLDAWYDSAIAGRGATAVSRPDAAQRCQDCHMPLEPAVLGDQAARDGKIRSHRFLGANTALPHLRGDEEQERRTAEFLRGAVSIDLLGAAPGAVDVVLRNRRVGHRFPGGTMDSNEVWIEVTASDGAGQPIAGSGGLDGGGSLDPAAHRVRAQPVDALGQPIAHRDVQHLRGVAFDTSLNPADPQAVRYRVPWGTATVRARLLYRKFERQYLAFACAGVRDALVRARCESPPVVEMAAAQIVISDGETAAVTQWERLVDHGLALADALVDRAGEALAPLLRAAALAPDRPEPLLGLARLALALGQTDETLALLDRLDARPGPGVPASLWLRATTLHRAYRDRPALTAAEQLLTRLPDDRNALGLVARLRGLAGDAIGALAASDRLLAIDPEAEEGLFQRMLALRDLGRETRAAEEIFLRHRRPIETDLALRRLLNQARPALAEESVPVHTHILTARGERRTGESANVR